MKHDGDMVHGFQEHRGATHERDWTASIVISSEHAGLRPHFKQLEAELLHALANIDDPRMVAKYLDSLLTTSRVWVRARQAMRERK